MGRNRAKGGKMQGKGPNIKKLPLNPFLITSIILTVLFIRISNSDSFKKRGFVRCQLLFEG